MFKLAFYTPEIIDLENSIPNDNHYSLIIALGSETNTGTFPMIDFKDHRNRLTNVAKAFTEELSIEAYGLIDDNKLKFADTICGQRDWQRYVFRLDDWHPLNDIFQQELGLTGYPLDFADGTSQIFYLVLHPQGLKDLIDSFYNWTRKVSFNIDD